MERIWRWAIPVLLVAEITLAVSGVLDARTALLVGALLESVLVLVALRQIVVVVRRYRRDRAAGLDLEAALEDGLAVVLPRPAARLVVLEPRLWWCLAQWVLRRRPTGPDTFRYAKRSALGLIVGMALLTAPLELLVFELIIPWPVVRGLVLIAGVYSILWLLGVAAAMQVRPHRLTAAGVRLYYGILGEGYLPYTQIAAVTVERRKAPKEGLSTAPREQAAYLAVGQRTDVTLRLRTPVTLHGLLHPLPPATTLYVAVDEPERFVQVLQQRIGAVPDSVIADTSPAAVNPGLQTAIVL